METQRLDRKRKIDHDQDSTSVGLSLCEMFDTKHQGEPEREGMDALKSILETSVLQAKLSNTDAVLSQLVKWFRIIANDAEKLRLFRQWVIPSSSSIVKQELDHAEYCTSTTVSSSIVSSSPLPTSSSLANILNSSNSRIVREDDERVPSSPEKSSSGSSTGTLTPDSSPSFPRIDASLSASKDGQQQALLQRLLQQQQQQIVLLQQLNKQSPSKNHTTSSSPSISIFPRNGGPGSLLTVSLKGTPPHPRTKCDCTLGFTVAEGTTTVNRIGGVSDSELMFTVPQISTGSSASSTTSTPAVVHLKLCSSTEPIMCLEPFYYSPRERSLGSSASDEDSEEMCEDAAEDDEGSPPPQALPPSGIPNAVCPTPKQMMSIRERVLELVQQRGNNRNGLRLSILQQPSVKVVWKNRRLDIPFKLKVEGLEDSASNGSPFSALTPGKLCILAVVADHKGRLQMDAAENFAEEFSPQGIAHFSNLRMTKGTWGKEWSITFAAVVKASLNNPVVVAVASSCPIVVKTRKNPQVRHNKAESSPPPAVAFIERKNSDPSPFRAKRHRVEDLLDHRPPSPPPRPSANFEDMASLLAAAELKQKEVVPEEEEQPCLPLMTKQNDSELSFTTFQNLMTYLEDIRSKQQISLGIVEQPVPKRDSKILIVKKGKPFRVPFQVQLRSTAVRHNPQNYVCVAVVRNDKGEEVAVRNSEVPFDWRGIACFAGLMVMKGTWGKAVQLTFEARWAAKRGMTAELPPSWSTQRMMVVSETAPTQLMCYTKDKKSQ